MNSKSKWILLALMLSLTANVFVIGIYIGKEIKGPRIRKGSPPVVDFNFRRFNEYLDEESQKAVRGIFRAERDELRSHFKEMKEGEEKIKILLSEETVDKAALKEAIAAHAERMDGLRHPIERILLEVVADLDHETRKLLAADMFNHMRRMDRDRKHRFRPPEGGPMPNPMDGDLPPPPEGLDGPDDQVDDRPDR